MIDWSDSTPLAESLWASCRCERGGWCIKRACLIRLPEMFFNLPTLKLCAVRIGILSSSTVTRWLLRTCEYLILIINVIDNHFRCCQSRAGFTGVVISVFVACIGTANMKTIKGAIRISTRPRMGLPRGVYLAGATSWQDVWSNKPLERAIWLRLWCGRELEFSHQLYDGADIQREQFERIDDRDQ